MAGIGTEGLKDPIQPHLSMYPSTPGGVTSTHGATAPLQPLLGAAGASELTAFTGHHPGYTRAPHRASGTQLQAVSEVGSMAVWALPSSILQIHPNIVPCVLFG